MIEFTFENEQSNNKMILIYLSVLKHNTLEQNLKSNLICCKRVQNKINLCTLLGLLNKTIHKLFFNI